MTGYIPKLNLAKVDEYLQGFRNTHGDVLQVARYVNSDECDYRGRDHEGHCQEYIAAALQAAMIWNEMCVLEKARAK